MHSQDLASEQQAAHRSAVPPIRLVCGLAGAFLAGSALAQPANDLCPDAEPIIEGISTSGDTAGASGTAEAPCSPQTEDIWYALGTNSGATYNVSLTAGAADMSLAAFESCGGGLLSGTDGRPTCRAIDAGAQGTLSFGGPGGTIIIRVSSAGAGGFDLLASSDAATGACCLGADCQVLTAGACDASGGSYLGDGAACGVGGPAGMPTEVGSSFPNLPIGPGAGTVTSDTISVAAGPESIGGLTVSVNLDHFFLSDLSIELEHVDSGTTVLLFDRFCGDNDDLNATFSDDGGEIACSTPTSGTFIPVQSLSMFNGLSALGDWTLRVTDNESFEDGTLEFWSITADSSAPNPCDDLPGCACEFGGSPDQVDVTDLLAFLALWFAGDAGADLNGGGVDVTDLLVFLACWFPASNGTC